jgi:endonuclease-8
MPEGDTVHKVARFMQPKLQGQRLVQVCLVRRPAPELAERTVQEVKAIGKHLLILLQGWTLRVHLGMHGSWHRYRVGEAWQRPAWQASLSLTTATDVWICFNAADVDLLHPTAVLSSPIGGLGPDLLAPTCDMGQILRRLRGRMPNAPLIDALLSQQISCGIGNVYKNDLCFFFRLHPLTPVDTLSNALLGRIYMQARNWLQANLGGWRRTTTYDRRQGDRGPGVPRLYVYGSTQCPTCNAPLRRALLGKYRRKTHWCPSCQPELASPKVAP